MIDLTLRRRFFAEEIEALANISTPGLVEAVASVPREQFLGEGPWLVISEADAMMGPRRTPDADAGRVYHNYGIAIDESRQLFNGVPALLVGWIDKLGLRPGAKVLHIGTGYGYYTALIGRTVGPTGSVVAIEIDPDLAARAAKNLEVYPWVDVRTTGAQGPFNEAFDAILVNAGVTHPEEAWLDGLVPGGRIIIPLTASMPQMGRIGKGLSLYFTKDADDSFTARRLGPVAIYSAIGLRDDNRNQRLGQAFMRNPFPAIKRLRRDRHEAVQSCWLHEETFCFSLE